MMSSNFYFYHC